MKKICTTISDCEQCPHSETSKVYTPDSFENVRRVNCDLLKKVVHSYLDWNDTADIPKDCPLENSKLAN